MSGITYRAAMLVHQMGKATVDDLMPHMQDCTRRQILNALRNANHCNGWLECDGFGPRKGKTGGGSFPATYRPAKIPVEVRRPEPQRRPFRLLKRQVPSVFHLCERSL